ncbi:hypothetical protein HJFPF1_05105 [Paramyrothecium foliicola]|nr:hypothetical protein HJFPF1_05105 [Paramyrothecium foliicola]
MDSQPATSPFFKLPPEIRLVVYRHLLLHKWENTGTLDRIGYSPQTAILRTCRRIWSEALPVLCGENSRPIIIGRLEGVLEEATSFGTKHFWRDVGPVFKGRKHLFQRFTISIQVDAMFHVDILGEIIANVSTALAEFPRLTHLAISLHCSLLLPTDKMRSLFENFGLLRGIGQVKFDAIFKDNTRRIIDDAQLDQFKHSNMHLFQELRAKMTGSSPLETRERLERMYSVLQLYVSAYDTPYPFYRTHSGWTLEAWRAKRDGDMERFKAARARLVERLEQEMAERASRLWFHDDADGGAPTGDDDVVEHVAAAASSLSLS